LIASASEHISGYSFVFLVTTFGVAFSLGWISEQYDRWKVKVKGQKNLKLRVAERAWREWVMGSDFWIDNPFYLGILPSA
jgi:hypothetical protein